jgi:hypothetical protein
LSRALSVGVKVVIANVESITVLFNTPQSRYEAAGALRVGSLGKPPQGTSRPEKSCRDTAGTRGSAKIHNILRPRHFFR